MKKTKNKKNKSKEFENVVWDDELIYDGYYRGSVAINFRFKSLTTNKFYFMFLTDFDDIVMELNEGKLSGKFTFIKRTNGGYGIKKIIDYESIQKELGEWDKKNLEWDGIE